MTDPSIDVSAADAQRARVEALREQRAPGPGAEATPAATVGPAPRRTPRRHVAGRSRVGVAAFSVATMLGLVGVMGLARPASSATPAVPVDTTAALASAPPVVDASSSVPATAPTAASSPAIAVPPVALTARPSVQVTTPTTAAPAARTNGSH